MTSQQENNQSMIKYFYTISFKTTSELSVIRFLTVDCIKTQPNLKLTQHQVQQIMEAQRIYNSWEIQDEQKLFKTYKFSSQREMDSFMNQTIDLLQQIHYQPIISMEGKKIRIELSNEEINGISVKDLLDRRQIMSRKINQLMEPKLFKCLRCHLKTFISQFVKIMNTYFLQNTEIIIIGVLVILAYIFCTTWLATFLICVPYSLLQTTQDKDNQKWLFYWIIFAMLYIFDDIFTFIVHLIGPFAGLLRIIILLVLQANQGSAINELQSALYKLKKINPEQLKADIQDAIDKVSRKNF
ncbi:Pterin-4-alpha-carbinolamine dehydratase 2 [Paramecium bursaria]